MTYHKFIDIFTKLNKNKNKKLALVTVNSPSKNKDMVGGFFISVYPEGKSYPRDFSTCGFQEHTETPFLKIKIVGVNEYHNINRISYTEISKNADNSISMNKRTAIK